MLEHKLRCLEVCTDTGTVHVAAGVRYVMGAQERAVILGCIESSDSQTCIGLEIRTKSFTKNCLG